MPSPWAPILLLALTLSPPAAAHCKITSASGNLGGAGTAALGQGLIEGEKDVEQVLGGGHGCVGHGWATLVGQVAGATRS